MTSWITLPHILQCIHVPCGQVSIHINDQKLIRSHTTVVTIDNKYISKYPIELEKIYTSLTYHTSLLCILKFRNILENCYPVTDQLNVLYHNQFPWLLKKSNNLHFYCFIYNLNYTFSRERPLQNGKQSYQTST